MRLDYDLDAGALYIRLAGGPVARTEEAGDNAAVDIREDGEVVGIEVLAIGAGWPLDEIIERYPVAPADAAQIRAYFRQTAPMVPADVERPVPSLEAAPSVPMRVPAAA